MQQTEPGSTLIYSSRNAEVLGIHKHTAKQFWLLRQDNSTDFRWNVYQLDQTGVPTTLLRSIDRPGERDRPWYKAAKRQQKPVWSPIFQSQSMSELIITASHPLFQADGELTGVLGFTISLSQLTEFLHDLAITSSGQAFIIERSGDIVATSDQQTPLNTKIDMRVNAIASSNPIIRQSSQQLLKTYQSFQQIDTKSHLTLEIQGKQHLIEVTPLNDGRGLDWLIVAIIPKANFTAQIQDNTRRTIVLCLVALLISLCLGIYTSRWISQIVARLIAAAKRLAQGEFDHQIPETSIAELNGLASSFNEMSEQLQQSFTALTILNTQLSESESRLKQFLEVLPVGVAIYRRDRSLFYCNHMAQLLLNLNCSDDQAPESQVQESQDSESLAPESLAPPQSTADKTTSLYPLYRAETNQRYPADELPTQRALNGETFVIEDMEVHQPNQILTLGVRGTPIVDRLGQITYAAIVFEDITPRQKATQLLRNYSQTLESQVAERTEALRNANQELERLAHIDGLTQLANRRYFDTYLQQEWRRLTREQQPLSLILFDVDFFKQYNDHYGHQAGDHCLIQVAQAAQSAIKRPADLAARYGGEEFVIVLPNTDIDGAITVTQRLQRTLQTLKIAHAQSTVNSSVTLSFGITCQRPKPNQAVESLNTEATGPERLLRDADIALYQAKERGRNQYALYDLSLMD